MRIDKLGKHLPHISVVDTSKRMLIDRITKIDLGRMGLDCRTAKHELLSDCIRARDPFITAIGIIYIEAVKIPDHAINGVGISTIGK